MGSWCGHRGSLSRFYDLQETAFPQPPLDDLNAACDVVRRQTVIPPLIDPDLNDRVPPFYYDIRPFPCKGGNDYSLLDRLLTSVTERAVVDLCVEPADVSEEAAEHTRCLAIVAGVIRGADDEDIRGHMDYIDAGNEWRPR